MSYIDESLIPGEIILHRARISWWTLLPRVLLGILLLVVVVGLYFLVDAWIRSRTTEIAITNKRVIAKFGFIKRHTVEINLSKVEALRVDQGLWGRLLDFGTIVITGAGTAVSPISDIADPLAFRRKFMEATDRQEGAAR
jgi:uncharacterized membrane protein YdbT with pleckstrin-like domain